jgi:hypothetical protein
VSDTLAAAGSRRSRTPTLSLPRFNGDCLYLKIGAKYVQPAFVGAQANIPDPVRGVTADVRTRYYYLRSKAKDPRAYLEGALGAATFIERVEVIINGYDVKEEQMGSHGYIYQVANRTYMTESRQKAKYGRSFPRVSNGHDNRPVVTVAGEKVDSSLLNSFAPLESDDDTTEAYHILRFGIDGESTRVHAHAR